MKIWVESRFNKNRITRLLKKHGVRVTRKNPDFVIPYGGDGTILEAECRYPGVPKIPIQQHGIRSRAKSYHVIHIPGLLERLQSGRFKIEKFHKVEGAAKGRIVVGLNEVQLRNTNLAQALRFSVSSGGKKISNLIGDGIVVATPYGSTAYYRAIGGSPFSSGIRAGFNNTYPHQKPMRLDGKPLEILIFRENAILIADNRNKAIRLKPGDRVRIRKSGKEARFVRF